MKVNNLIALMAVVVIVQMVLIIGEILPPLAVNSSGNLLFDFAKTAIIAYTGWAFSKSGLKEATTKGVVVTLAGVLITFVAVLIGVVAHRPVLGMVLPSGIYFVLNLLVIGIANIIFGAIVAVIGTLAGRKVKK
ncbi:Uncharacterised protein [uncultured archaeon]|nr:Uncharacterised protein [uncultured archaeon]